MFVSHGNKIFNVLLHQFLFYPSLTVLVFFLFENSINFYILYNQALHYSAQLSRPSRLKATT